MQYHDIKIGCYVSNLCCLDKECGWWEYPMYALTRFIPPPRNICPDCGGSVINMVGRFKMQKEKGSIFNWDPKTKYLDFLRKDEVTPKPSDRSLKLLINEAKQSTS